MMFKDLVTLDAHFQNSINIGLDLGNEQIVNSYIPTHTGLNYLNHFISNVISDDGDHSSMLIAPYGKGKSHAVLVMLSFLCNTNYSSYHSILDKITKLNSDLYNKLMVIKDKKYLPVIISNTRGTLNQSLLLSLQKSLNQSGINSLLLATDFAQAEQRINEWKKVYPETYSNFLKELDKERIAINTFIKKLKSFDEETMNLFKDIHKRILSNSEFVPQNTLEVVDYYQEIAKKLISDYDYDGMYIVFDEFSKFLESREEQTIANDMKIIQDLAELCNNSKSEGMYLQLILHKPISDYLSIDKKIRNAFKGIEGRVSPYYFTSTLKNTFDLISNVLDKNDKYFEFRNSVENVFNEVVDSLSKLPAFYSEFDQQYIVSNLIDACYPLHPLTVYLLIKINEKVAQNERTLFTFLAKKNTHSLPLLIEEDYKYSLIMPSVIFDFFEQLLVEEKDDISLQKVATNALSALKYSKNDDEVELIKTIALLLIVNEKETLSTNLSVLATALMKSQKECKKCVDDLIERNILVQRHDGQIQFKINMDLNLESTINDIATTKYTKLNIPLELSEVVGEKYFYPRIYNIRNSITRFFKVEYIYEDDFLNLDNVKFFFENGKTDGVIINVLRNNDDLSTKIKDKVSILNNDRVVVVYPKYKNDYASVLRKMKAVQQLLLNDEFIVNNTLVKMELELMYDDLKEIVSDYLDKDYSFNSNKNSIYCSYNNGELTAKKRLLSKDRILGEILSNAFSEYPSNFNLELINKNEVKGVYKKARENVVDLLLNDKLIINKTGTSPEDTIINCLLVETNIVNNNPNNKIKNILSVIEEFIATGTTNFGDLYNILVSEPYGLRKGIIPLLLAIVLKKNIRCLLLKYKNQEVDLNAHYLEMLNDDPSSFTYVIDEVTAQKDEYINLLSGIFGCSLSNDMAKNYSVLLNTIKQWYSSLPKFTKQMIGVHKSINQSKYKRLRKQLSNPNVNASEFILYGIPKIVDEIGDSFDDAMELSNMKRKLDNFVSDYLTELKNEINDLLGFDKDAVLTKSVNYWIDSQQQVLDSKVLDKSIKDFITICRNSLQDNEYNLVNKIAYCFTSYFVEDWSSVTHDVFIAELNKLIAIVAKEEAIDGNKITLEINGETIVKSLTDELDDSVEIMENFIESTMEDFGEALSNEQKIAVLVKIMKKYF